MKRLLFICPRMPYPPTKGEICRAFHELRALAERFDVTVATMAHSPVDWQSAKTLPQWCGKVLTAPGGGKLAWVLAAMSMLLGRSATEGYFHNLPLARMIDADSRRAPFDLVFCFSSAMVPYALRVATKVLVTDLVDIDSAKWAGYSRRVFGPRRWINAFEAHAVERLERLAVDVSDVTLVISEAEAAAMSGGPSSLTVIEHGIDTDYFTPGAVAPEPLGRNSIVFTGTMNYPPNAEGVQWFAKRVFEPLRRVLGEASFTIVGRDPTAAVRRLEEIPGVRVTGAVDDVRPYLAGADVAVCPLLIARGIQSKLLEAMSMGKAIVASSCSLDGLKIEIGRHAVRADTIEQWTQTVGDLLRDPDRRAALGQAAGQYVRQHHSWQVTTAPLVDMCLRLCEQTGSSTASVAVGKAELPAAAKPAVTRSQRRRDRCWAMVRRQYHDRGWRHAYRIYEQWLDQAVARGSVVLDVGCGREFQMAAFFRQRAAEAHGIDPMGPHPGENDEDVYFRHGVAGQIPYPDATFDIIACKCVLEHLEHVDEAFREFARVLKPGGRMIFLTPNRYDYVSVMASIIPNAMHGRIVKAMEGRDEQDTFPVFYRCNTMGTLRRLAGQTGLTVERLRYHNHYPSMFMSWPMLCRLGILYDRMAASVPRLEWLQSWILGCLHKPAGAKP